MSAKIRCAIYTRKSSEEGLDQDFNSLDAQHEACAAYILSQKGEGWSLLADRYDDGGVSGGTLERRALERLMAEVDAGRVDMIVVYKIDRLTRSLSDFAKLVDRFEAAGCSFVSVTQAFNTSSSMGRLTLNMLLSFAQFEREVTAERIRDKIAASKKRGLWMGGVPPLGYDAHPDPNTRSLVINETDRGTVEVLYALYDDMGCLREVESEAARRGLRSRRHVFASGRAQGGGPLSRGQIHHILCNQIYAGRIRHKDRVFDGQHPAIIAPELWDRVQARLQAASARPRRGGKSTEHALRKDAAPLTGKVRDPTGDRLTPTHTRKGGRRIRYYISNRLLSSKDPTGWRLPAERFEASMAAGVAGHLGHMARRHDLLGTPDLEAGRTLEVRVQALVKRLQTGEHALLSVIVEEARIGAGRLGITFDREALADILQVSPGHLSDALLTCTCPFEIRRRGVETRIVIGGVARAPDQTMLRALAKAHAWTASLKSGSTIAEIARREEVSQAFIRTRAQLACLSPRLQRAILEGTQPVELTLERLIRGPMPLDWSEQERRYGLTDR